MRPPLRTGRASRLDCARAAPALAVARSPMDALTSHCVRSDGERPPRPERPRGGWPRRVYALGADGIVRATPARHVNAAAARSTPTRRRRGSQRSRRARGGGVRAAPRRLRAPHARREPVGALRRRRRLRVGASGRGPRAPRVRARDRRLRSDCAGLARARALWTRTAADDPDGVARRSCRATPLSGAGAIASLRVLARAAPAGDAHLVVSDGALRVFDAAAGDGTDASAMEERAFRLDPWGRGPRLPCAGWSASRPARVGTLPHPPRPRGRRACSARSRPGARYPRHPRGPGRRTTSRSGVARHLPDDPQRGGAAATPSSSSRIARGSAGDAGPRFRRRVRRGGGGGGGGRKNRRGVVRVAYASRRGGGEDESDSGRGGAGRWRRAPAVSPVAAGPRAVPLGTDPIEGDGGVSGGGGASGAASSRALAVAPARATAAAR